MQQHQRVYSGDGEATSGGTTHTTIPVVAPLHAKRMHLFSGCLTLALLGAMYASFNVVAAAVAQQQHLTSTEVALVAYCGVLGSWLHLVNGPFVSKYGPLRSIAVGTLLWTLGFGMMAASLQPYEHNQFSPLTVQATTTATASSGQQHQLPSSTLPNTASSSGVGSDNECRNRFGVCAIARFFSSTTSASKKLTVGGYAPLAIELALCNFIGMQGASFATMAALSTVPVLFPKSSHAEVMGIMGATFALGQAFISTLYSTVLRHVPLPSHFSAVLVLGLVAMLRGAAVLYWGREVVAECFAAAAPRVRPIATEIYGSPTTVVAVTARHTPIASFASIISSPSQQQQQQQQPQMQFPYPLTPNEQSAILWLRRGLLLSSVAFFAAHLYHIVFSASSNDDAVDGDHSIPLATTSVMFSLLVLMWFAFFMFCNSTVYGCCCGASFDARDASNTLMSLPPIDPSLQSAAQQSAAEAASDPWASQLSSRSSEEGETDQGAGQQQHQQQASREAAAEARFDFMLSLFGGVFRSKALWLMLGAYFACAGLASALNAIASSIVASLQPLSLAGTRHSAPIPDVLRRTGEVYALGALGRCWGGLTVGFLTRRMQPRHHHHHHHHHPDEAAPSTATATATATTQEETPTTGRFADVISLCAACHAANVVAWLLLYAGTYWSDASVYVTIPLVGFVWGMLYTLSQVSAIEVFGAHDFPTLWGVLSSSPCVSTYLFSVVIAGSCADAALKAAGDGDGDSSALASSAAVPHHYFVSGHEVCLGAHCYGKALFMFLIFAVGGACCFAVLRRERKNGRV